MEIKSLPGPQPSERLDERDTAIAATRLAQEAKQALAFRGRGVRDITNDFTKASNQLQSGQLVKDESFTLFEAVGALEIMDPKMDSGFVPPDDAALDTQAIVDPPTGMDVSEILWIMDHLFCLEITWLDGYPLSQTVFTSLHIDRLLAPDNSESNPTLSPADVPRNTSDPHHALIHDVLRAYCIALIKCCHLVMHTITNQNFYEEEDFVTHMFGRELLPKVGSRTAVEMLSDSMEYVTGLISSNKDNEALQALEGRLSFRKHLLEALEGEGDHWEDMPSQIASLQNTHGLTKPVPEAFSEKVQRHLATSTPPRPIIEISWAAACRNWTNLFDGVIAAHRLASPPIVHDPQCLQRAMWTFAYLVPEPCVFARAEMQDILFGNQNVASQVGHYDLLLTDMRDLVLAGDPLADPASFEIELPSDPRHKASRLMSDFMDRAIEEYLNLYRMVCQNRCRIRRTFTQAIKELDDIESEAMLVDEDIQSVMPQTKLKDATGRMTLLSPLTSWTKFYKLRIMEWTVQLGFETEIYMSDEFGAMYWFLGCLADERCRLLHHTISFLTDRRRNIKGKDAEAQQMAADCAASHDLLSSLYASANTTRALAGALSKLFTLLVALGILPSPTRSFANRERFYEARMKPFLAVRNGPIPSAAAFHAATQHPPTERLQDTRTTIAEYVSVAKRSLADLKRMAPEQARYVGSEAAWKKEVRALETTCVAVDVAASQLVHVCERRAKGVGGGKEEDLSRVVECGIPAAGGGKRYHEWWVVPQIRERKG